MENDIINDVFDHVLGRKTLENVKENELWQTNLEKFDYPLKGYADGVWQSDSFSSACFNIAQRFWKTKEQFKEATTDEILANISFESAPNGRTEGTRQTNRRNRRVQFLSAASAGDQRQEIIDSNEFDNLEISQYPYIGDVDTSLQAHLDGHDNGFQITNTNTDGVRTAGYSRMLPSNTIQYNNPFDPRILFDGLAYCINQQPDKDEHLPPAATDMFNCVLEGDNPTAFTNNYLSSYRKYVSDLSDGGIYNEAYTYYTGATANDDGNKGVPAYFENTEENRDLWRRITETRRFWRDSNACAHSEDIKYQQNQDIMCTPVPTDVYNATKDYTATDSVSPNTHITVTHTTVTQSPLSYSGALKTTTKPTIVGNSRQKSLHDCKDSTESTNKGNRCDTNNGERVVPAQKTDIIRLQHTGLQRNDSGQSYYSKSNLKENVNKLAALNDIAEYVTKSSSAEQHVYSEGDVQSFLVSLLNSNKRDILTADAEIMTAEIENSGTSDAIDSTSEADGTNTDAIETPIQDERNGDSHTKDSSTITKNGSESIPEEKPKNGSQSDIIPFNHLICQQQQPTSMFWSHHQRQQQHQQQHQEPSPPSQIPLHSQPSTQQPAQQLQHNYYQQQPFQFPFQQQSQNTAQQHSLHTLPPLSIQHLQTRQTQLNLYHCQQQPNVLPHQQQQKTQQHIHLQNKLTASIPFQQQPNHQPWQQQHIAQQNQQSFQQRQYNYPQQLQQTVTPAQPHQQFQQPMLVRNSYGLYVNQGHMTPCLGQSQLSQFGHQHQQQPQQQQQQQQQHHHHQQQQQYDNFLNTHPQQNRVSKNIAHHIPFPQVHSSGPRHTQAHVLCDNFSANSQDKIKIDDEVWYINGVPHYQARPDNQPRLAKANYIAQGKALKSVTSNETNAWQARWSNNQDDDIIHESHSKSNFSTPACINGDTPLRQPCINQHSSTDNDRASNTNIYNISNSNNNNTITQIRQTETTIQCKNKYFIPNQSIIDEENTRSNWSKRNAGQLRTNNNRRSSLCSIQGIDRSSRLSNNSSSSSSSILDDSDDEPASDISECTESRLSDDLSTLELIGLFSEMKASDEPYVNNILCDHFDTNAYTSVTKSLCNDVLEKRNRTILNKIVNMNVSDNDGNEDSTIEKMSVARGLVEKQVDTVNGNSVMEGKHIQVLRNVNTRDREKVIKKSRLVRSSLIQIV